MYQTEALLRDTRTCFTELNCNLYLSLSWMDIEKKYFSEHKRLGTHTTQGVQNNSGFETEHRKTCLFPSKLGSSIPTFRDM